MNTLKTKQMEIDLTSSDLVQAHLSDWKTVADITGEAFAEDPVNQWVFGKPGAIRSMFRVMAREMYLPQGLSHLHPAGGATMWMPPGVDAAPSQVGLFKFALGQLRHGTLGAIKRGMALSDLMQAWHPERAAYVPLHHRDHAGCARQRCRQRLAGSCSQGLRCGGPARLSRELNPANSGFYATHGFERMGVFEIGGDGSPIMEPMWREAKT